MRIGKLKTNNYFIISGMQFLIANNVETDSSLKLIDFHKDHCFLCLSRIHKIKRFFCAVKQSAVSR